MPEEIPGTGLPEESGTPVKNEETSDRFAACISTGTSVGNMSDLGDRTIGCL